MVKNLVVLLIAAVAAVSCLKSSGYSQTGTVVATMEYAINYSEVFEEDSLYYDSEYNKIGIDWNGLLSFHHKINDNTSDFEGGFVMSYLKYPKSGETAYLLNNKYRANAKNFTDENTYLVFEQTGNMPEKHMSFAVKSTSTLVATCTMQYCFVNNTVAVAEAVKNCFVPGDKLILKAKGYLGNTQTGTADITLAEKTASKDSVVYTWTQFDLSKLGAVDKVDFELVPDAENWSGPMTVCLDNVAAYISIQQQ